MIVLSLEHLLEMHTLAIQQTGGDAGIRDLGRLESVIAAQTQEVFGEELYPTISKKAAALIKGVAADHPFVDGNKRTAMLTGLTFLNLNGVSLSLKKGEIEDFAVKIATDHLDVGSIAIWINNHI